MFYIAINILYIEMLVGMCFLSVNTIMYYVGNGNGHFTKYNESSQ